MSRDLGRDVPDLEKLYARKLWADFSYPKSDNRNLGSPDLTLFLENLWREGDKRPKCAEKA